MHRELREAKTMGDFESPVSNTPLLCASFRITHMVALHKNPFNETDDVVELASTADSLRGTASSIFRYSKTGDV